MECKYYLENAIDYINDTIDELEELEDLEEKVEELEEKIGDLEGQIEDLENHVEYLEEENKVLYEELNKIRVERQQAVLIKMLLKIEDISLIYKLQDIIDNACEETNDLTFTSEE